MPNEKDILPEDLVKHLFNAIDRGPAKPKKLVNAERKKAQQQKEREARSKRDKLRRAARIGLGLCTRCGEAEPVAGKRLCDSCQEAGRNYVKLSEYRKELCDES